MRDYWSEKEKHKLLLEAIKSKAFIYIPSLEKNILDLLEKNSDIPESFEKELKKILKDSKKMVMFSVSHDGEQLLKFFSIRQFLKGYNEILKGEVHINMKITEFY